MIRALLGLVVSTLVVGCTVLPKVEYRTVTSPASMNGMTDAFYRNQSTIEVEVKETDEVTVTSKPVEYRDEKLAIRAISDWRSSTMVNLTKTENSDMVSSVGVSVTDNTVKAINDWGGAVVKLVGFAVGVTGAKSPKPCMVRGSTIQVPAASGVFKGNSGQDCIRVALSDLPKDAAEASAIPQNTPSSNYYYSACREAKVEIIEDSKVVGTKTVRVADPKHVQFVQFPVKGSIKMHSECGVSVVTDEVATPNGAAIVDALATQGKAIKDAIDAAKKP